MPKIPALDPAGFARLSAGWKRDGRSLYLIGDSPPRIDHIVPGLTPIFQLRRSDRAHE